MSKEAMKLALEALEETVHWRTTGIGRPPEQTAMDAITALRQALANEALDKMAENARELGLDYEPSAGMQVSKVWWDGEKLMAKPIPLDQFYQEPAQQEPVAWPCLIAEADFAENTVTLAMQCTDYKVSAGKHWLSNTPPAQRTWAGLTDEELRPLCAENYIVFGAYTVDFIQAIEAKLKEKNNG